MKLNEIHLTGALAEHDIFGQKTHGLELMKFVVVKLEVFSNRYTNPTDACCIMYKLVSHNNTFTVNALNYVPSTNTVPPINF